MEMWTEPMTAAERAAHKAEKEEWAKLDRRIANLENALAWYGEQARLCRLIHSEGDAGRHALAEDGGERARGLLGRNT